MMKGNTKLSIITINYNNRDGLQKTIESVVGQTFHDIEYVVIDGGSTDGSVDVIKEYADKINYWVSEKDNGIYHAMNKGVKAAHGEYALFLNSGDCLCNEHVIATVFEHELKADIVCGDIINDKGGRMDAPEKVTMEYFMLGCLPHPSSFIRRKLFDIHPFNEQYMIGGDWEFFMFHLIRQDVSYQHIELPVTFFDTTGISSTSIGRSKEEQQLAQSAIEEILKPRVLADYNKYLGNEDNFYLLFGYIYKSRFRKTCYRLVVLFLKMVMLNKGWIRHFSLKMSK